jgi:hypothetical protein
LCSVTLEIKSMGARKNRKGNWSYEDKIYAVKLYEVMEGDRDKTMEKLREEWGDRTPTKRTLNSWIPTYIHQVSTSDKIKSANAEIIENYSDTQDEFIKESFRVKFKTLKRIDDLINTETNLTKLTEFLKVIHNISEGLQGEEGNDGKDVFNFINNQLIVNKDGKKEDRPSGDSESLPG